MGLTRHNWRSGWRETLVLISLMIWYWLALQEGVPRAVWFLAVAWQRWIVHDQVTPAHTVF